MRRSLSALTLAAILLAASPAAADPPVGPYARLHQADRVHWQAFSPAVLEQARRDGKLVFISVGYAACHFCHVMAREVFADAAVGRVLDADFVSILVDRDQRPDLDSWFGRMLEAMGGQGGWPTTLLLTPDLVPLFGANAMPLRGSGDEPGFLDTVTALAADWHRDPAGLEANAESIRPQLRRLAEDVPGGEAATDPRDPAARAVAQAIDPLYGGFGGGAKFPQPAALILLLHQAVRRGDAGLLARVTLSLDHMAAGGVRDQLGGAFHRYAVDRFWQMPHFEIGLADNALLARLYLEAFQATGRAAYGMVAQRILDDLAARLRLPDGGFATALAAETGGVEGATYTWTADEIRRLLPADQARSFIAATFDSSHRAAGTGPVVLRLEDGLASLAVVESSRAALLAARATRPQPERDETVQTSANALAAGAFATAARILRQPRYLDIARATIGSLLRRPWKDGALRHARQGERVGDAVFLDDYAFLIGALLDLADAEPDPSAALDHAAGLARTMLARFRPDPRRPLLFTPAEAKGVLPPQTLVAEDGTPSGNAVALADLWRLALWSESDGFAAAGTALATALAPAATAAPGLAAAWDYAPAGAREVVLVGRAGDPHLAAMQAVVAATPLAGTVFASLDPDRPLNAGRWPLLAPRPLVGNRATAYVCHDGICDRPTDSVAGLGAALVAADRR